MTDNDIDAIRFVYRRRGRCKASERYVVATLADAPTYRHDQRWQHAATVDPGIWLGYVLNHPGDLAREFAQFAGQPLDEPAAPQ